MKYLIRQAAVLGGQATDVLIIDGKIAQLGQRLIDGAAKSMAEDFFKRFDHEMQRQHPDSYAAKMVMGDVNDQASAGTAKPAIPIWVWLVGVAVLGLAIWLGR